MFKSCLVAQLIDVSREYDDDEFVARKKYHTILICLLQICNPLSLKQRRYL